MSRTPAEEDALRRSNELEPPVSQPEERLADLIRRYGHVIRAAVRKAGGAGLGHRAEDVEQSVLLEVWKQVAREQEIRFPSSYLYRAAVRETVRLMKKIRRRAEEALNDDEASIDPGPGPGRQFRSSEIGRQVRSSLAALRFDRRLAVRDHLAGYRVREIMKRHGWAYGRARNLIVRGMADLRNELRGRGIQP